MNMIALAGYLIEIGGLLPKSNSIFGPPSTGAVVWSGIYALCMTQRWVKAG